LLNGFVPAGRLRDDLHVSLAVGNRCNPLPQERVIIHTERPNADLVVHLCLSPVRSRSRNRLQSQEGLAASSLKCDMRRNGELHFGLRAMVVGSEGPAEQVVRSAVAFSFCFQENTPFAPNWLFGERVIYE
jgi:hypothetical protein